MSDPSNDISNQASHHTHACGRKGEGVCCGGACSRDVDRSMATILGELRSRQRMLNIARCTAIGAFAGLVAALGVVAFAWVTPQGSLGAFGSPLLVACTIALLASIVVAAIVGALLPIADLPLARAIDRASGGDDRFASAFQLRGHRHQDRVRLIAEDAIARVRTTSPSAALPLSMPRAARWAVLPLAILAVMLFLLPDRSIAIAAASEPEISSDEWSRLHEDFASELKKLPKAETPEEEEMRKMLEELAKLLEQNPEKKDVLKEIAKLSEKIEKERQALPTRDLSMKNAAKAMARSEALKQFASTLKQGEYDKAATELQKLAEQMDSGEISPDANEFESMAEDLEKLAQELNSESPEAKEMQKACEQCSKSASSMNKKELAEAMKRLSQQMKSNCKGMCKGDSCRKCQSLLDMLRRGMSQCKGGKCNGNGLMPGMGAGKGGTKAGWGSAAKWDGGELAKNGETRTPDMTEVAERGGESSSFKIVSPDERAASGKSYEELYAEFVQKSEADLDLDSVPVAYREFLSRYFNGIRPRDGASSGNEKPETKSE